MEANTIFNKRNQEFFDKAKRAPFRAALGSGGIGGILRAVRNAARLASIARFQRGQTAKRSAAAKEGRTVPGILIASVTRKCNLDCAGCYSKALRADASPELSDERFLELFREAAELGVGTLMLAGTLVDEEYMDLFSAGRLIPVFSIEGDAAFTTERRGAGVHDGVLASVAELRRRGALFGFSVTLTSKNADSVLSERFSSEIGKLGASVLFLIEFVPVVQGSEELVLTDPQKAMLARPGRFDGDSFMTISLPGDEEAFGGCLAAGRGFIHLADDGSLEACPFAPFSDTNAVDRSLRDALDSPLMRAIRERHSELTETKGGCALWNKRGWVASLGACSSRTGEASRPVPA